MGDDVVLPATIAAEVVIAVGTVAGKMPTRKSISFAPASLNSTGKSLQVQSTSTFNINSTISFRCARYGSGATKNKNKTSTTSTTTKRLKIVKIVK